MDFQKPLQICKDAGRWLFSSVVKNIPLKWTFPHNKKDIPHEETNQNLSLITLPRERKIHIFPLFAPPH